MRKFLPFLVILIAFPTLGWAQACDVDSSAYFDPTDLTPHVTIRIRLPIPLRFRAGVYYDFVLARHNANGTWDVIRTLDDETIDVKRDLSGKEFKQDLEKMCPGASGELGQLLSSNGGPRGARSAIIPPPAGQASQPFVTEDFDGDGNIDLAAAEDNRLTVSFLKPDLSVRSKATFPGVDLAYVVAGDFNGDGRLDLVVSPKPNTAGASASILLNGGGGVFQSPQALVGGASPSALAAGDFNGDTKLDLAVANANAVSLLLGNGNGTFQPPVPYATGSKPGSLIAADFNGDGKLDLAVLNWGINTISLLRGNGNGTFQAAVNSPGGPAFGFLNGYMAYSDFDHDGKLDLLIRYATNNLLCLLLGNSDGSFQASRNYVAPEDNSSLTVLPLEDGSILVFMVDRVTQDTVVVVAPGDGTLSAPPLIPLSGNSAIGIASADFNGDSRSDLVIASSNNQALVMLKSSTGLFQAPVAYPLAGSPTGVAVGDLNGDGRPDAVFTLRSGTAAVMFGSPTGTLTLAASLAAGNAPSQPELADLNKDGKPDLIVVPQLYSSGDAGNVTILLANESGARTLATGETSISAIAVGDWNNDQNLDIAVTATSSTVSLFQGGNLLLFRGRGDGTFLPPTKTPLANQGDLEPGDFNGDGKLDLALSPGFHSSITIFLGNGDGTWRTPSLVSVNAAGSLKAVDFNRDGNLDLLNTTCCGVTDATYLLGNGDGSFQPEKHLSTPYDPVGAAVADFNGDGTPDVAFVGKEGFVTTYPLRFPALLVTSAAAPKYRIAPDSIASAYGPNLAKKSALPGTKVTVKDASGITRNSTLFYVSQQQINFAVPAGTAIGNSVVTVTASDGSFSSATVQTEKVVPALFTLNAAGLVAANVVRVSGGATTYENIYQVSGTALTARPVDLGPTADQVYLVLYGTGLRAAGTAGVTVSIGGIAGTVLYAGPQGEVEGFDQVNVQVPRSLIGKGTVDLILTASGVVSNTVTLVFK